MAAMHAHTDGTNLTGLRDHNAALVLALLRRAPRGGSRVELAAGTGLTPQAISKIVARLLDEGLVEEAGRGESTGGKPRTLLRLRPESACAVGVQLDRHETTVVLVDLAGDVRHRATTATGLADGSPAQVIEHLAQQMRHTAAQAADGARVLGAGVGCRGPLDYETGVLHRPAGLPAWDHYPIRDALAERLDGLAVRVDKDTNVATLAIAAPGDTAYLHVADGVGAGLLLGGKLYRGARTNAGEFGHQVIDLDGPECTCGGRGCLEAMCLAALAADDQQAAARLLGVGAANLVRLLDVDRIILGGRAVLAAPELYRAEVLRQLAERLPDPDWQHVTVAVTPPDPPSVAAGAAELLLGPLFGQPH